MRKQRTPDHRLLGEDTPDKFTLFDNLSGKPLSSNPNVAGAKLCALWHVENGDKIYWESEESLPAQVAHSYGVVNGVRRFRVAAI